MGQGDHNKDQSKPQTDALRFAFFVTLAFMGVEWVVGWWGGSLALLGDAAHMATDSVALGMGWFAAWLVSLPKSPTRSFGFQRAEILVALCSGFLIWLLTGMLLLEAFDRVLHPETVRGLPVLIVAVVGLGVNTWILRRFHHAGHDHKNLNLRAAYLHVLGDLLGSVCAIVSGFFAWQKGWYWMDPLVTFVIAVLLMVSSFRLVTEAFGVLMEFAPVGIKPEEVKAALEGISGVTVLHDLHIWSVSSRKPALSVHLVMGSDSASIETAESVLREARKILDTRFGIHHSTIQVERAATENCVDCN